MKLENIEGKFLEVIGIKDDDLEKYIMTRFPIPKEASPTIKTDPEKNKAHGEVFTPLWLVDQMVSQASESLLTARSTHDLCAGYGQFTIRMMRFLAANKKDFDPSKWLKEVHSFSELQVSSAYKLLYIFGTDINLFIGDARELPKLKDTDNGIMIFSAEKKKWIPSSSKIKKMFGKPTSYSIEREQTFINNYYGIITEKDTPNQLTLFPITKDITANGNTKHPQKM